MTPSAAPGDSGAGGTSVSAGDIESMVLDLARGLRELGHEVRLLKVGHDEDAPGELTSAYERLADVDLIHDHTLRGALESAASRMVRPPVVVTAHLPFTAGTRRILAATAHDAAVVALSRDHASRAWGVPIAAVIPQGVDVDVWLPGPGDGGYLAFVGTMGPEGGLLHAARIARDAGWPLRVAAEMRGPHEREYFEEEVRPVLADPDAWPGDLGRSERVDLVQHAAAVLHPTRWAEPSGLAIAHSLAASTPVIASARGAAPEFLVPGRTGFVCSTEQEAAESVHHLDELDRAACRASAASRLSLERMARAHIRLYGSILEDGLGRLSDARVPLPRQQALETAEEPVLLHT